MAWISGRRSPSPSPWQPASDWSRFLLHHRGDRQFIMTLGMGTILAGIVLWISNSNSYTGLSDWLVVLITNRDILGLPFSFYIAVVISIIVWVVFEFTPIGRQHLFVGKSREVSKLNGIAVGRVRTLSFVSCSVLAAVGGIMYAGAAGGVDPTSALTMLLPAFAAAFLGSTTIMPGQFNHGVPSCPCISCHGHNRARHPRIADICAKLLLRWSTHHCRIACSVEQNGGGNLRRRLWRVRRDGEDGPTATGD